MATAAWLDAAAWFPSFYTAPGDRAAAHCFCVPDLMNRLLTLLIGAVPRRLVRRVTGLLAHRVLGR